MANFEEDTAKKIKEQLESGELDIKPETEVVEESKPEVEQEQNNENVVAEGKLSKNSSIFAKALGTAKAETKHFERKEKVRPLGITAGVLSFLVTAGIIAVCVFGLIKLIPPLWGAIVSVSGFFFTETVLAFSLGLGWLLGGVIILMLVAFMGCIALLFGSLAFTTIGIPIVAFKTARLPKQVFAHEKDSFGNMIFSYIVGLLILAFGFLMLMDGSFGFISYIVMAGGAVFIAVAILITVDRAQCRKVYNNLEDEVEKQEIKAEAEFIEDMKKTRQKNRKLVGKVLGKLFSKK